MSRPVCSNTRDGRASTHLPGKDTPIIRGTERKIKMFDKNKAVAAIEAQQEKVKPRSPPVE